MQFDSSCGATDVVLQSCCTSVGFLPPLFFPPNLTSANERILEKKIQTYGDFGFDGPDASGSVNDDMLSFGIWF
jgi:hypothetical protein